MRSISVHRLKGFIGFILILTAVVLIFYWEHYGRETFLYQEIIVAKEDININEVITEDNIMTIKVEKKMVTPYTAKASTLILGKASKQFIPYHTPIDFRYLENPKLVLDKDEYILRIPNQWIITFPGSLRRGDQAFLLPVKEDDAHEVQEDRTTKEETIEINIAYVKDASNREVVTVSEQKTERFDGTSNINAIEVIATMEMTQLLNRYVEDGYRFIILYQSR